ncbi:hypothetical protein [uncultured Roseibium sp.]|uniref:hypothetical protein n=1 Tax=uncultured Roseibium sp. TaxID=1936171 RepID=UPI002607634B|nr:hypothetical protein [uncultured Roseibium sp.]
MNPDYAHLLNGAELDYTRLGLALKAVIEARGCTLYQVQQQTRISRASVSRATAGIEISTGPLLLLCIWADLNPFELLRPMEPSSIAATSCGDTGDYRVFHSLQGVKPSEKSRQLRAKRRSVRLARAKNG